MALHGSGDFNLSAGQHTFLNEFHKRRKLNPNEGSTSTTEEADVNFFPVLANELIEEPALDYVYVAEILEKKQTSKIIKLLQEKFPLQNHQHLKRVKSSGSLLQVIICLAEEDAAEKVTTCTFLEGLCAELKALSPYVLLSKVPHQAPRTRQQYEYGIKWWPVQFHENKRIAKAMAGTLFSEKEKFQHIKMMKLAISEAKDGNEPVGAVIADSHGNVIAASGDRRHCHPLQHAAMLVIDRVAHTQGGGAWHEAGHYKSNLISSVKKSMETTPYLCTGYTAYLTREPCIMSKNNLLDLKYAYPILRRLTSENRLMYSTPGANRRIQALHKNHYPEAKCSMALIHSRINCVFYGESHNQGALETLYKLHTQVGLNHHFEVFRGVLENECEMLKHG